MTVTIWPIECRQAMRSFVPPRSIDTVVTSPPYFGLRDYDHGDQIGLESSPDAYVAALVDVFRGVREVLRDDGTVWLNLGDSYAGSGKGVWNIDDGEKRRRGVKESYRPNIDPVNNRTGPKRASDIGAKQLYGIPWRVAFALQADGWYLRQDIIWHKPNPMPESVRDRCTKAHEYIFLLSKSEKYYFDWEAIKEPAVGGASGNTVRKQHPNQDTLQLGNQAGSIPWAGAETRNKRSVWTVSTKPYKGAHFATFPIDLIEPCILAGSRPGGTVLDPFGGSGTVALAARKHGRSAVLCECNPKYIPLIHERLGTR